jgi:DNA polymerase-3 subunit beta
MEFTARKDVLLKELSLIQGIVERRNTIPVLSNVLIDAGESHVDLAATDLDVGLRCRLGADVKKPGALTLSAKKLFEIARAVSEQEIEVKELENFWASITSGRSFFKMVGLSKTEFPSLADPPEKPLSVLPGSLVREVIQSTSFAITSDDSRYFLNGARLEIDSKQVRMVATDGHRLAFISVERKDESAPETSVIVPKKTLLELVKMLSESEEEVEFSESENHLFFRLGERLLVSKRVDDQFPAYEKVIPRGNDKIITCNRERFQGAIRRVCLLANERSRAVRLSFESGKAEVSSQNPELGEAQETLEVDYDGEQIQVGFNGQYILDFLNVVGSEKVQLELKNESSQGLLRPSEQDTGKDYQSVVMPMRL